MTDYKALSEALTAWRYRWYWLMYSRRHPRLGEHMQRMRLAHEWLLQDYRVHGLEI